MTRTLAILVAVAMFVPAVYADDIPQQTNPTQQANPTEQPVGTMTGTGFMIPNSQPMMINTPVNPNPMATNVMNGIGVPGVNPIAGLLDLGLSQDQVSRLIDQRAKLWKEQVPYVDKLMDAEADLALLEQASPLDYGKIKSTKKNIVDIETELRELNDKAVAKAKKVLTDEQAADLGDRALPLFMLESMPAGQGMHTGWGMHGRMMGPQSSGARSGNTSGK